tara:strand:- start:957 stop:1124 length:168 start_codon:yes stop_codon:yes gene_type:complete
MLKTQTIIFRDKKMEVTFQSNNLGIVICGLGEVNILDSITFEERNEILLTIMKNN